MKRIVLASDSPRRKEILSNLGVSFTTVSPLFKEISDKQSADAMVRSLSLQKALAVVKRLKQQGEDLSETLVIAADTAVVHQMDILGKPKSKKMAVQMLKRLRNDTHFVTTGITLLLGQRVLCETELTKIHFSDITDEEIENYVKSSEAMDKAGAYGIQGTAALWIDRIEGDYFNVVGFPVHRFYTMLKELGLTIHYGQE